MYLRTDFAVTGKGEIMRLIDGNALKEAFYQKMKELLKSTDTPQISNEAISLLCGASLITDAPTIYAVPVMRCKDCKHYETCRTTNVWAVKPGENWFCADGERKEDE